MSPFKHSKSWWGPERGVLATLAATVHVGCASSLPVVPTTDRAIPPFVEVERPPPAPFPEVVPPPPPSNPELLWADGCWKWSAGRWVWVRGGWVIPPAGAVYARGRVYVTPDGRILASRCVWVRGDEPIEAPEPKMPALSPPSPRMVESLR